MGDNGCYRTSKTHRRSMGDFSWSARSDDPCETGRTRAILDDPDELHYTPGIDRDSRLVKLFFDYCFRECIIKSTY